MQLYKKLSTITNVFNSTFIAKHWHQVTSLHHDVNYLGVTVIQKNLSLSVECVTLLIDLSIK